MKKAEDVDNNQAIGSPKSPGSHSGEVMSQSSSVQLAAATSV